MLRQTASTFAVLALASPAIAQITLDEVVMNASLVPIEQGRTGASVGIVNEAQLRAAGQARALALMESVAGVTFRTTGAIGTNAGFSIRGASQNYVKVTVDGMDITDPSQPQIAASLGAMSVVWMDRIEVVKGSQSAIHGAGAIGGVIAISSLRPTEDGTRQHVNLEAGTQGTLGLSWGITHRSDRTEAAFQIGHLQTDGFSAAANGTEADGHRQTRASFHIAHELQNGVKIGASGFHGLERTEFDPEFYLDVPAGQTVPVVDHGWGPSVDLPTVRLGDGRSTDEISRNRNTGLRLFTEFQGFGFTHVLSATATRAYRTSHESEMGLDWSTFVPGAAFGTVVPTTVDTAYTGQRYGLQWMANGQLSETLTTSFGLDASRESYEQTGDWGNGLGKVRHVGVFGELLWTPVQGVDVSAALRRDHHSEFGGATVGRVAVAWSVRDDLILRGQAGTGYRAPSPYERFAPGFGNAALRPEESRSLDLGIEKRFGDQGFVRATAFWLSVDNLIDWSGSRYDQIPGISRRQGVELEGEWSISDRVVLGGSWTHVDSPASAATTWLVAPPKDVVVLSLGAQLGDQLSGGLALRHVRGQSQGLKDFTTVSAALSRDFGGGTTGYLRLENVFDTQYQTVPGYASQGRSLRIGVRKTF